MVAMVSTGSLIEGSMVRCTTARKVCASSDCDVTVPTLLPLMRTSPPVRSPSTRSKRALAVVAVAELVSADQLALEPGVEASAEAAHAWEIPSARDRGTHRAQRPGRSFSGKTGGTMASDPASVQPRSHSHAAPPQALTPYGRDLYIDQVKSSPQNVVAAGRVLRQHLVSCTCGPLGVGPGDGTQNKKLVWFVREGESMRIERRFTTAGQDPYSDIEFRITTSEIRNPDGSRVFHLPDIDVPADWSQVACDILAQKYFRKAGVPAVLAPVVEEDVPDWLWRRNADEAALQALPVSERFGSENSARQVFDRLAGTWTYWGWKGGYFDSDADARAYHDEMRYMLCRQMAAPNSPQWFNTGLHWAYGIDGPSQGHYYVDFKTGELTASNSAYEHPQPHACFIQSVADDLVNEGGIMDLWVREARLFKYGS